MTEHYIQPIVNKEFFSDFVFSPDQLPFTSKEIIELDNELARYEQLFLDPDVEKNLISKNEFLTSFGISKAEQSALTLKEAMDIQQMLQTDPNYDFIGKKIKSGKKLVRKDYEKLEFFNITKTFAGLNRHPFSLDELSKGLIKDIHASLTRGMDVFNDYLPEFTLYKSGNWRDNNLIRVGEYVPIDYEKIENAVDELINWFQHDKTIVGTAVFHTLLYAIHPFNNGNKRVCRVLEHLILRQLGVNSKNIYSTSYYYHREKPRYYKNLVYSIERKNLNHFVSFILEAIVLSIISVVKTGLETKRDNFLKKKTDDRRTRQVLKPLVKRRELQFKNLYKLSKRKFARQTFVNFLNDATAAKIISRRESGRKTFYRLNLTLPEEETISRWLQFAGARLSYIPDELRLS